MPISSPFLLFISSDSGWLDAPFHFRFACFSFLHFARFSRLPLLISPCARHNYFTGFSPFRQFLFFFDTLNISSSAIGFTSPPPFRQDIASSSMSFTPYSLRTAFEPFSFFLLSDFRFGVFVRLLLHYSLAGCIMLSPLHFSFQIFSPHYIFFQLSPFMLSTSPIFRFRFLRFSRLVDASLFRLFDYFDIDAILIIIELFSFD